MKFYRFYGYWKRDLLESGFVRKLYQLLFLLVFYCSFMQLTSCSSAHQWVQHEDLAKRVMIDHGVEQEKVAKLDLVSLGVSEVGKGFESVAGAGADDRGDSQRRSQEKLEGNESRQNALGRDESEGSKIAYFSMQFLTNQKLDVKAMRKIIVENVESFIQRVNAEEELKARLLVSPITVKQLRLNIGCCDSQGDFREPPYLAYAHLSEDKICYCYYDNLFGKFIDVKDVEEPYQEAVKIVLGE